MNEKAAGILVSDPRIDPQFGDVLNSTDHGCQIRVTARSHHIMGDRDTVQFQAQHPGLTIKGVRVDCAEMPVSQWRALVESWQVVIVGARAPLAKPKVGADEALIDRVEWPLQTAPPKPAAGIKLT